MINTKIDDKYENSRQFYANDFLSTNPFVWWDAGNTKEYLLWFVSLEVFLARIWSVWGFLTLI